MPLRALPTNTLGPQSISWGFKTIAAAACKVFYWRILRARCPSPVNLTIRIHCQRSTDFTANSFEHALNGCAGQRRLGIDARDFEARFKIGVFEVGHEGLLFTRAGVAFAIAFKGADIMRIIPIAGHTGFI